MEYTLSANITIDNVEEALKRVQLLSGCSDVSIDKIADFCKSEVATMYYIDDKLNSYCDENSCNNIVYLWVDTGYISDRYGQPIFLSLIYKNGGYTGHFVGDAKSLSNMMAGFFPMHMRQIRENLEKFRLKYESKIAKRTLKHYPTCTLHVELNQITKNIIDIKEAMAESDSVSATATENHEATNSFCLQNEVGKDVQKVYTDVTQLIWDRLLFEHWNSMNGLDYYIKICGCRLQTLVDENKTQYFILNNIKSAVINTGLMNQFGQDILVMYRWHVKTESYCAYKIIESKTDLLLNDFAKEQASKKIDPISFFGDGDVFDADSIDDFDINYHSLFHVLRERKDRFPDLPEQLLAEKLKNAIALGVNIAKRDKGYVRAFYTSKKENIQWVLPFHVERDITDEPELVMIVAKKNDFYEMKTILPYDEGVKEKIIAMSLYSRVW